MGTVPSWGLPCSATNRGNKIDSVKEGMEMAKRRVQCKWETDKDGEPITGTAEIDGTYPCFVKWDDGDEGWYDRGDLIIKRS